MFALSILVSNLHCPSCVRHVEDVLTPIPGILARPDVSLIAQTIKVKYDDKVIERASIVARLLAAAFEVQHVTVLDRYDSVIDEHTVHRSEHERTSPSESFQNQLHLQHCSSCQQQKIQHDKSYTTESNDLSEDASRLEEKAIDTNSRGTVSSDSPLYKALISIEGMTCGSCVGMVTRTLEEFSFVSKTSADLLSNAATVEFRGRERLEQILEGIEDVGYEATLIEISKVQGQDNAIVNGQRVVEIRIDGMHCHHCPGRIVRDLQTAFSSSVASSTKFTVLKGPTLKIPHVRISYVPSSLEGVTVRNIISHIKSVDPSFTVSIYHPPTVEERSQNLQKRERRSILLRLIFVGIIAIPSFILGVVYMSLVSHHNPTRMWFAEPLWIGNASRLEWALFFMTTPVMVFGTDLFHKRAFKEIWAMWRPGSVTPIFRRLYRFGSMNMLISVGTLVAYISSLAVLVINLNDRRFLVPQESRMSATYFDAITFLTFFILTGKFLEAYSKAKAGDTVAMLGQLKPREALLIADGVMCKISADQLEIGDIVQIPHGHSPPADGIVLQDGSFAFNESSLTGESKPVSKSIGDTIFTGTINVADPVQIQIIGLNGSSMLDRIIDVVRQGQAQRAPIERFADILTGYFVPVVTLIAVITWVVWLSLGLSGCLPPSWVDIPQGGWYFWSLEFAIAVLVVACPCGIGLAAPTALFVGGGLAAKQGILVQGGGQAFQEASSLSAVVFDKTGTLTQGRMKVIEYEHTSKSFSSDLALAMAKTLEETSTHPIAQAITGYCPPHTRHITLTEMKELPGYGMKATLVIGSTDQQQKYETVLGNEKLVHLVNTSQNTREEDPEKTGDEIKADVQLQQIMRQYRTKGHTLVFLAVREQADFQVVGVFAVGDILRPEAKDVVLSLQALNIDVHLCTGDEESTALAIASQLNIPSTNIRANVLPQDKAKYIEQLQSPGNDIRKLVGFVGDGLNDTPALTAADVSISLSSGSDIAMTASSFILLNSHLDAIPSLLRLSKRVFQRVKVNFFWAAIYNVTLIPVAAGVFFSIGATDNHGGFRLNPVWAAAAMAGSSVSVVLSSLALKLPELHWNWNN